MNHVRPCIRTMTHNRRARLGVASRYFRVQARSSGGYVNSGRQRQRRMGADWMLRFDSSRSPWLLDTNRWHRFCLPIATIWEANCTANLPPNRGLLVPRESPRGSPPAPLASSPRSLWPLIQTLQAFSQSSCSHYYARYGLNDLFSRGGVRLCSYLTKTAIVILESTVTVLLF